jgi:microcystin-dependent protein
MFGGNFAPRGWAFCNGQLLSIAQNTALFSLLGTTYGGNGQTTFALPDLRSRAPVHFGQGPGLTNRDLGEQGGEETHTLITTEMPAHSHPAGANNSGQTTNRPADAVAARGGAYASSADTSMGPASSPPAGGSQPHNNMQPYLAINYIIALEGIYPSRN